MKCPHLTAENHCQVATKLVGMPCAANAAACQACATSDKPKQPNRVTALVALGGAAAKYALQTTTGITRLRGTWAQFTHTDPPIQLMPTFHPAYLLRSYTPDNRKKVWADLQQVIDRLVALAGRFEHDPQVLLQLALTDELLERPGPQTGLDLDLRGDSCGYKVLGDITPHVGGGAVNFGWVLARKSSTAVGAFSTVGVDNNFSAGYPAIANRSADDEPACRVDIKGGVRIDHIGRQHRFDDLLHDPFFEILVFDYFIVLG